MISGVGGVRKLIHQCWLVKRVGLRLLCWDFKGSQEEIPWEEADTLQIGSVAFPPGQRTSPHNSIIETDYLTKMGLNTVPQPPYSPDLAPCDFWLFPNLRDCRQLRRWKRLWRRSLTRSHKRTSMGSSRSCSKGTICELQLKEISSKGDIVSCVYYQ